MCFEQIEMSKNVLDMVSLISKIRVIPHTLITTHSWLNHKDAVIKKYLRHQKVHTKLNCPIPNFVNVKIFIFQFGLKSKRYFFRNLYQRIWLVYFPTTNFFRKLKQRFYLCTKAWHLYRNRHRSVIMYHTLTSRSFSRRDKV